MVVFKKKKKKKKKKLGKRRGRVRKEKKKTKKKIKRIHGLLPTNRKYCGNHRFMCELFPPKYYERSELISDGYVERMIIRMSKGCLYWMTSSFRLNLRRILVLVAVLFVFSWFSPRDISVFFFVVCLFVFF